MKKIFMLLMFAGSTVMFASCDSKTETTEETTVVEEVEAEEGQVEEVETEEIEFETTSDTTAIQE